MAQSCKFIQRDLRNLPAAAKCKDVLCVSGRTLSGALRSSLVYGEGDLGRHSKLNRVDSTCIMQNQS